MFLNMFLFTYIVYIESSFLWVIEGSFEVKLQKRRREKIREEKESEEKIQLQKTQLQPPFDPSVDTLCRPCLTTTNLSYRFLSFEISTTTLWGTTGIQW